MTTQLSQILNMLQANIHLSIAIFLMVLLRIPSLFEGFWYGDEGIYAALAQGMLDGRELYVQVWDHKPPMIYWLYYFAGLISNWAASLVILKIVAIIASGISLWLIQRCLQELKITGRAAVLSLYLGAVLLGLPILEANTANAEVYFMPFNVGVLYLLLRQKWYGAIGLLAGLGAMFKFHSGFESAVTIVAVLALQQLHYRWTWPQMVRKFTLIVLGGLAVIIPYAFYVLWQGHGQAVLQAILWYNFHYTSYAANDISIFGWHVSRTQLLLCSLIVALAGMYLAVRRWKLSPAGMIALTVLAVEYTATLLPGRSYGHYLLQAAPGVVLVFAWLLHLKLPRVQRLTTILLGVIILLGMVKIFIGGGQFSASPSSIGNYYVQFVTNHLTRSASGQFPFDQGHIHQTSTQLARHLNQNYPGQSYFLWGNLPWVLALTDAGFTNTYVVWYHQSYDHPINQESLEQADVVVIDTQSWQADEIRQQQEDRFIEFEQVGDYLILSQKSEEN